MFNPITPQFVYMIHKEKEREREREIELARIARERGTAEPPLAWFAQAAQRVSAMLFRRAPVRQLISQPQAVAEPCNCEVAPC